MAKKNKIKFNQTKELMATPEQMNVIENALGQPIEEWSKQFLDNNKMEYFAKSIYRQSIALEEVAQKASNQGTYQPIMANQYTTALNLNPLPASSQELENWLMRPQYYSGKLRGLSQYLSYAVGQYKNLLDFKHSLKAFNYILTCASLDIKDMSKEEVLKDIEKPFDFLRKLNVKWQLKRIDLACLYDGVFYGYINKTNESWYLVQLPPEACYIVAPWNYGWRYAVDLAYFDKFIGQVKMAIPELGEAYEAFIKARMDGLEGEKLASMQYYPMPVSKSWCFTSDILHSDAVPPNAPSMTAALEIMSYRSILKNKLIYELYKIIALKIPMTKDGNKMAITYKEAAEMVSVIQSQLPENVRVYASPFDSEGISTNQVDNLKTYLNIGTDSFSSASGVPEAFLGGDDELHQGTALKIVNDIEFEKATTDMYIQYENFINFIMSFQPTKLKYQVHMFGNATQRDKEIDRYAGLIGSANMNFEWLLATMGLEPFEMMPTALLSNAIGITDLMKPIVSAFNTSSSNAGAGRPQESGDGTTSDGASNARDYQEV